MYYLYILKCSDGSLYTGVATNLQKRFETHESGKGSKYVRARLPFEHVYTEEFENRSLAQKRETEIKRWDREKKMSLFKQIHVSINKVK